MKSIFLRPQISMKGRELKAVKECRVCFIFHVRCRRCTPELFIYLFKCIYFLFII